MTPTRGRPFTRSQSVDWFGQKTVKRRRTPPLSVYVRSTSLGATCAPFHESRSLAMTRSSLPLYTVRTSPADERERQRFNQILLAPRSRGSRRREYLVEARSV